MPRRGKKPVVYLDQNWISEITKSQIIGRSSKDDAFYSHLSSVLHTGVSEGKFACPTSDFHNKEASFNPNLRTAIPFVACALSHGLSFNSFIHINHKQLVAAALEFAGQDVPSTPWWHIPFNRDPDTLLQWSPDLSNREHPIMIDYMKEVKRIRDGIQTFDYCDFKKHRRKQGLSYEDEVRFGRDQIFREQHIRPAEAIVQGRFKTSDWESIYSVVALQALCRYTELKIICDLGEGIGTFLNSHQFAHAPFLSISSKLRAADIVRFPNRDPEQSLIDDFHIVATVLPYASVFATENYLAELIKQTGLDKEYDCSVYRMKQREDFLGKLEVL